VEGLRVARKCTTSLRSMNSSAASALKMPRAIEILDAILRRLEHGEITAIEAIDALLAEELTLRENRRIKIALVMARLSSIKTLGGFDFSFQPSLDKNRIMAQPSDRVAQQHDTKRRVEALRPAPGKGSHTVSYSPTPRFRWRAS